MDCVTCTPVRLWMRERRENKCENVLEFSVICAPTGRVDEASCDTRDEELVRDDEFYGRVERLSARGEHRVQLFSLRNCTRETIEYKARKHEKRERERDENRENGETRRKRTHPFLHALLFSSWSRIMPTMMSSETSPPASIIFFASTPSGVFLTTCSRSMSPVAR